jgi:hypothetical protein
MPGGVQGRRSHADNEDQSGHGALSSCRHLGELETDRGLQASNPTLSAHRRISWQGLTALDRFRETGRGASSCTWRRLRNCGKAEAPEVLWGSSAHDRIQPKDAAWSQGEQPKQRLARVPWPSFAAWGAPLVLLALVTFLPWAGAAPCPSTNGHLRFGTISYRQVSGYTVTFFIETQWRRSYSSENVFAGSGADGRAVAGDIVDVPGVRISDTGVAGPVVFQTGDGTEHPLFLTVTHHSLNQSEDFLHGYSTLQHTYRAPNDGGNDWLASLSGCCRQYGPEFREFFITSRVNLALDGESLRAKALPVLVITNSPLLHSIKIPANTYMGGVPLAWRIGKGSELGTATMPAPTAADFPVPGDGILVLNGSALGVGCHPLVVQIASVRSVTPYDCIIKV